MGFALKISLPGYDVKDASPEHCAVHTSFNSPKIDVAKNNFVSFNVNFNHEPPDPAVAGTVQETIIYQQEHGYNYVPQCWVEVDFTATFGIASFLSYGPGRANLGAVGAFDATYFGVRCDSKYMYLYVRKESSPFDNSILHIINTSLRCRVYVFAEEGVDP